MRISFENSRLSKLANNEKELTKKYDKRVSVGIQKKLTQLSGFENLNDVPVHPPFSRHKMSGNLKGCFSIDVLGRSNSMRIVFKPVDESGVEIHTENLIDITHIKIVFIGDYH